VLGLLASLTSPASHSAGGILGWHIGYNSVTLAVAGGGTLLLHWLWPHLGQAQWILLGWKLMEVAGWDPFAITLAGIVPASVITGEYLRRQQP
jgi:hypothetical protein